MRIAVSVRVGGAVKAGTLGRQSQLVEPLTLSTGRLCTASLDAVPRCVLVRVGTAGVTGACSLFVVRGNVLALPAGGLSQAR